MSDQDIINALKSVAHTFSVQLAIIVEKVFRNETAHFKSGGFINTLSPGMEATKSEKPYGWSTLQNFWIAKPEYAPSGLFIQKENSSAMLNSRGERTFIKFNSIEASMMSVAYLINVRGGDGGRWFSNEDNAEGQAARAKYNVVLNGIIPRFCNANLK